jgi:hypothetical protein
MTRSSTGLGASLLVIATTTLLGPAYATAQDGAGSATLPSADPPHAFDWEHGAWTVRLSRLVRPLSGSDEWTDYEGTSVVRPVWGGVANLGELDVTGPTGRIVGLSLRLYDPGSGQWRIHWANRSDGVVGIPMVGGFADGRGEFYNYEPFDGRVVLVRFVFSDIGGRSFRFEQSFSDDHGRTWEPNWVAEFSRQEDSAGGSPGA